MSHRLLVLAALVVCLDAGRLAVAQEAPGGYATPAHVSVVQGTAALERNGQAEAVTENLPLLEGDRLRTEAGRLEVILPDASVLALDHDSTLDLLAGGIMRLVDGRMVFIVSRQGGGQARDYQVDAPAGIVRFVGSGDYRVSATTRAGVASVDVAVVWGKAVVEADGRSVQVAAGQRTVVAEGEGVAFTRAFNAAATDDFYAWEDGLRAERVGAESDAYLPSDLQVYGGAFDRDGTWDDQPDYGWVWYPRVSADWRPYYHGFWQPYGWGWTWVGGGSWAWPTHHYGRWGHAARGWFWIPGAQWGPAWVSWGYAGDYVSWCPLGDDDSPVFGLSFGFSRGARSSPWLGWTVMSRGAFGRSSHVPLHALRGDRLRAVERASFTVRRTGPTVPAAVLARRRSVEPASAYDRAQRMAGPRQGGSQGMAPVGGGAMTSDRPTVARRPWTDDPASPYGRAQDLATERAGVSQGIAAPRGGSAAGRRPTVAQRPWTDNPASPYGRAQDVATERAGVSRGIAATRGGSATGRRPTVAQRPWTDNPASPYGRAQDVATERLYQAEPGAALRSRAYDTRPFESPSRTPLPYPDRFRPVQGPRPSPFAATAGRPSYSMPGPAAIRPAAPPEGGSVGGRAPGGVPRGSVGAARGPARAPVRGGHKR